MQSKTTTVAQYLKELPEDRRAAIEAVRKVVNANLDQDYEEGMQYGMIGWYVPHRVFPAGYHCDPKQPLPFAALASQKNYMSLYMMGLYCGCGEDLDAKSLTPHARWFHEAWAKTGKKLDMGKCCIRFKKIEDLPLEVIGEAIQRVPARKYIADYEATRREAGAAAKPAAKKTTTKKPASKKTSPKAATKKTAKKTAPKERVTKK